MLDGGKEGRTGVIGETGTEEEQEEEKQGENEGKGEGGQLGGFPEISDGGTEEETSEIGGSRERLKTGLLDGEGRASGIGEEGGAKAGGLGDGQLGGFLVI